MNPTPPDETRVARNLADAAPWGRLWQAPLFLIGAACLLLVHFLPCEQPSTDSQLKSHILQSRQHLSKGDAERALAAARQAWELSAGQGEWQGDVRAALGLAYLASLGKQPGDENAAVLRRARADLEMAHQLGVSPEWRGDLLLNLARTRQATGAAQAQVIPLLQSCIQEQPPCAEAAYRLLVELRLKQNPPQIAQALLETEKWLLLPTLCEPNAARLQRGELLVRTGRRMEAIQTLQRIPGDQKEFPSARILLAQSFQEEHDHAQALQLWLAALREGEPAARLNEMRYKAGLCHLALRQRLEAERIWQPIWEGQARVKESMPVWLKLAQIRYEADETNGALAAFDEALRLPEELAQNPYISKREVSEVVDAVWQAWRAKRQFVAARRLMEVSHAVIAPSELAERIGLTCQEAAEELWQAARNESGAKAETLARQARQQFQSAGEAYAKAAQINNVPEAQSATLWKAAQNFLRGQSPSRAITELELYLTRDLSPQRRYEALVGLGEALQAANASQRAVELLHQALEIAFPHKQRARYVLALAYMDQQKYAEAEAMLRSITAVPDLIAQPPELSQSRFAVGHVLLLQGQYREAISALENALRQYPNDEQALLARYRLADACLLAGRQQVHLFHHANQDPARDYYRQQRRFYYEQALTHFQKLTQTLSDMQEKTPLATQEAQLLLQARFGLGDCLFHLGRTPEAASVYESLALQLSNQAEGLTAWMHLTQCRLHLEQKTEAKQSLMQASKLLQHLPDEALRPTEMTRQQWLDWQKWAEQACAEDGQ